MQELSTHHGQALADLRCLSEPGQDDWQTGPLAPVINESEVHVWRIKLNTLWSKNLDGALSEDDRIQAGRFHFEVDRQRFSVARAALRVILGRYLGEQPAALKFERNAFGKPYLLDEQNRTGLRFNLSHSHELALLAVTRGREVGVDVEFINPNFASREVAGRFFSRAEIGQLEALAPALRTDAFFTCWTRKEAYIKARGEGLSLPLDEFDLSLTPEAPPVMLANRREPAEVSRWSFRDVSAAPGYAGALAIETGAMRLWLYGFASER